MASEAMPDARTAEDRLRGMEARLAAAEAKIAALEARSEPKPGEPIFHRLPDGPVASFRSK